MKDQQTDRTLAAGTQTFNDLVEARLSRRQVLQGGLSLAALSLFGGLNGLAQAVQAAVAETAPTSSRLGFKSVPVSTADTVVVPEGYQAKVLFAWGDPVSDGAAFAPDASNTAAEQAQQAGMHHDGMHFFPLPLGSDNSEHGLLVMNHEYIDPKLLHTDGLANYSTEKLEKELAAHGVSVIEIKKVDGQWQIVRPSQYGRRVTTSTPMQLDGAAAGSEWLKTNADPSGKAVFGTMNNCANGHTPWGTYLACEENFHNYFAISAGEQPIEHPELLARYSVTGMVNPYWGSKQARFDLRQEPNEVNRFGWIVEIDPFNPDSTPVKHTAMGRFSHENAALSIADDKRVVFYSGDDSRFEYIYKFVSSQPYDAEKRDNNKSVLSEGTLYVAKFNEDGSGEWLPLVHGQNGLTAENGFADQAAVLVKTRLAADKVGATPMDRPEWIAVHPDTRQVYATLTNNSKRKEANAANPRTSNNFGHIVRWQEAGNDPTATAFNWDIYVLCGDPASDEPAKQGNIKGDLFCNPDGLWIAPNGTLWIQTDISSSKIGKGDFAPFGNNQMLASDPDTGEIRRFLTGPKGCEITGIIGTPDLKTLFVNIQHPGEDEATTPENPTAVSSWPTGDRPRSATVVIQKLDGAVIGS